MDHVDEDHSGTTVERFVARDVTARRVDLSGADAREVRLRGARATDVDLTGLRLREVLLSDVVVSGASCEGRVEINGDVDALVVNGVEVGPLVEAELRRRHPDYAAMTPTDADGFRRAYALVGELWADTVERARALEPAALHASVDGEWSFTETLRHLVFATESWVGRTIEGDASPWHPLSLPWDGMPDTEGVPRDRDARPDLDTVLALRADRTELVRRLLDGLTDADLDREVVTPEGPGWPPAGERFPLREPLLVVLNEEWWHRRFAERDLDVLERRT